MAKHETRVITAEHPERGTLYAAIDPNAHHVAGRIAERRFGAFLAPFQNEDAAQEALALELEGALHGER